MDDECYLDQQRHHLKSTLKKFSCEPISKNYWFPCLCAPQYGQMQQRSNLVSSYLLSFSCHLRNFTELIQDREPCQFNLIRSPSHLFEFLMKKRMFYPLKRFYSVSDQLLLYYCREGLKYWSLL